jgi:hypothetical protein
VLNSTVLHRDVWGNVGIDPRIILEIKHRRVVIFTHRPVYRRGKITGIHSVLFNYLFSRDITVMKEQVALPLPDARCECMSDVASEKYDVRIHYVCN